MLIESMVYVIEVIAGLLFSFFLYRFWLQVLRLRPPQGIGKSVFQVTDWAVLPLRKIIPGWGGYDWASVVAGVLLCLLASLSILGLLSYSFEILYVPKLIVIKAVFLFLHWCIYAVMGTLILEAILSFINPHAPIAPLIRAMNVPLLTPFRKVLPSLGGLDFSGLILIVLLQLLNRFMEQGIWALTM